MRYGVTFSPKRIIEDMKKAEVYVAAIENQLKATNARLRGAKRELVAFKKLLGNSLK